MKNKFVLTILAVTLCLTVNAQSKKIAIIGGGISGIATADEILKKDPTADITIFEKRERLGGNARTHQAVNAFGDTLLVDMGPQYFAEGDWDGKGPWDNYVKLLKEYGLYDSSRISRFLGNIVVNNDIDVRPDFVSPKNGKWRGETLGQLLRFFKLFNRSKKIYWGKNEDYPTRIEDWVEGMPMKDSFKIKVVYPFLAASLGTSVKVIKDADTKEMTKIVAFGRSEFQILDLGMGTMVQLIGKQLEAKGILIQKNAEVLSVEQSNAQVKLKIKNREDQLFDHVVMAIHADQSKNILSKTSGYEGICSELSKFGYFKAHIVLHSDSSYVNNEKPAFLNVRTRKSDYTLTSSTMNLSQVNDKYKGIFKSWLSDSDYQKVKSNGSFISEETFYHPNLPHDMLDMLEVLQKEVHKYPNIHLAGGWTEGLETQETAILSGRRVVGEIYD